MIRELKNAQEILIYHKGCYGCGRTANLYHSLQKYLVEKMNNKLPSYQVRRIDYDMKWQDELESAGLSAPAVKITKTNGEIVWVAYKELEQKIKKAKQKK